MVRFSYTCYKQPIIFELAIKAIDGPCKVFIVVEDAAKENTEFTNRYKTIAKGKTETFFIRLPQSPHIALVKIFGEKGKDNFEMVDRKVMPLIPKMEIIDFGNRDKASFIKFAQEFCEKAGSLSPGQYESDDRLFVINYDESIKSRETGKELNTPARINSNTGIVQVSKSQFDKFTVPARFIIMLHEFCHVFANKNMRDEIEADFHAAQIYLAMGYPQVDMLNIFATIFYKADTELNRTRFQKLYEYARGFDEKVHKVKYLD